MKKSKNETDLMSRKKDRQDVNGSMLLIKAASCEYLLFHEVGGGTDIVHLVVVRDATQTIPPNLRHDVGRPFFPHIITIIII